MKRNLYLFLFFVCCCLSLNHSYAQPDTTVIKPEVAMEPSAGWFDEPVQVTLKSDMSGATIYYTLNGLKPTSASMRYKEPIQLDSTAYIQAVAYANGVRGDVEVNTYFINEPATAFPVASIIIDPVYLFDPVKGVFKLGPRASRSFPFKGANFYSKKEFETHFEFFEAGDKKVEIDMFVGLRVFGGMSRQFPQKSISLAGRKKKYGKKYMKHAIFPDRPNKKYKHIVFRNSGSDFGKTHFRDAMITSLGAEMGLEVQAYRPCITYINGEYWGIYNLREKLTKHYIRQNFGYDPDSIDLMEHRKGVKAGSRKHYVAMQQYMRTYDLAEQRHFDTIATRMDVDNFMEYEIVQMYIDNGDAGGNIKFWRPQTPDGRWRWILYDTDFGFGHFNGNRSHKVNSVKFHLEPHGPGWPNPPWSTFNLRMLLKNQAFKDKFITRFADRLNYTFNPKRVIERIDSMANYILPELPRHWEKWNLSQEKWQKKVDYMRVFAKERPAYIRQFLRLQFPYIGDDVKVNLDIEGKGVATINGVIPVEGHFEGVYFKNLPITIKARPRFGYRFSHWVIDGDSVAGNFYELNFTDTLQVLKAVFLPGEHPLSRRIIINEISSSDTVAGDWIEFFNGSEEAVELKGWVLRDGGDNTFVFPDIKLEPQDFLVLCQDLKKFKKVYPTCSKAIGDFKFGLGEQKEKVELYDQDMNPVDSVGYDLPKNATGQPFTLALQDYRENNNDFDNWTIEKNSNPASANAKYIETEKAEQFGHLMDGVIKGVVALGIFAAIVMSYMLVRKRLKKVE